MIKDQFLQRVEGTWGILSWSCRDMHTKSVFLVFSSMCPILVLRLNQTFLQVNLQRCIVGQTGMYLLFADIFPDL